MQRSVIAKVAAWLAGLCLSANAAPPLALRVVSSTQQNFNHRLSELVDGNMGPGNGLDMDRGQFEDQFIVFATQGPVTAQLFQFTLWHNATELAAYPARVELAITTDPKPNAKSDWKILKPDTAIVEDFAIIPDILKLTDTTVNIDPGLNSTTLTIRAASITPAVTGFRLHFIPVEAGHVSGKKVIGRSAGGNCVINEFRVEPDPLRSSNIALAKPVKASGPVYRGLSPQYLTDGFAATFSHPAEDIDARNFHFEIDLGSSQKLDHLMISGRLDNNFPERLGEYHVQLLDDDGKGKPGRVLWSAVMRQDDAPMLPNQSDVIVAANGRGERFGGRFLRILNVKESFCRPQVGEVEVYAELTPAIGTLTANGEVRSPDAGLPSGTREIGFSLRPGPGDPVPDLLRLRWRMPGLQPAWQETPAGEISKINCGGPGSYLLEFQACHTDGHWDEAIRSVTFEIPLAWWKQPLWIIPLSLGLLALIGGSGWRISVRRLQNRLKREQAAGALQQERLRIARDMHDDIGARLTHLALLADRAKRSGGMDPSLLSRIAGEARVTVGALDQIVWSVSPQHDTTGSLTDYLRHYAPGYLSDAGLSCRLEIETHNRETVVPFSIRHPLLMVTKEALQNVVKHAGASRVIVRMSTTETVIHLEVEDDGKGFDATDPALVGQEGLGNMQGRLAEVSGTCIVHSSESGTRVVLDVPLPSS